MIDQGWQCPICKRVYSPRQKICLYCSGDNVSSPVIPTKPFLQGGEISWDTINSITHAINTADNNWTTITSSCGEATISADKLPNSTVEINGVELKTVIENSVKEKLNETTLWPHKQR